MRADYAACYEHVAARHWWWQSRDALVLSRLRAWMARHGPFGPILDVGCGSGRLFDALRTMGDPQGIEPDPNMIPADGPWRSRIQAASIESADLPRGRFGLILLLDVLEHLENDRGALLALRQALHPGGMLALNVPALPALWSHHDAMNHHFRRYTAGGLRGLVRDCGYELVSIEFAFAWSLPGIVMRKLVGTLAGPGRSVPRVPPHALNRLCRSLCRVEDAVARILPLPLGSSLFLLARRGESGFDRPV